MTSRYLEMFFRHKYLLCLPIVLGLAVSSAFMLRLERDYVASSSFWADSPVPQESTNGTTGGASPPSQGESALLTQMLGTRAFLMDVVQASPLATDLGTDEIENNRVLASVARSIEVSTPGPQLVYVDVTGKEPAQAVGLADAVLSQFSKARMDLAVQRARETLAYQQRVLEQAEAASQGMDPESPPRELSDARTAYNDAQAALAAAESSHLNIVDEPIQAVPQGRMKKMALGALGGMLAGAILSLITLILLVHRDRSLRKEEDAESLGLTVVSAVPEVASQRRGASSEGTDEASKKPADVTS